MSRHVAPRHISVSCRVMSRHFTSRRIMSHYVALCLNISAISHAVEFILVVLRSGSHVMSRHVAPCHISVSCWVMSRHFTSRRIMSHYVALCLNISAISHAVEFILVVLRSGSHVMSRHVASHRIMSRLFTTFHVMSRHVLYCHVA